MTASSAWSLWVAGRYLMANNSAFSYVSRLALLGLVLSVTVLVVVLSVVNGFERELRERVLSVLPHVTLYAPAGLPAQAVQDLDTTAQPENLVALAAYISGNVLLAANDNIVGASLTGIDASSYSQVTQMHRFTTQGGLGSLEEQKYGVIVGAGLAARLKLEIGDRVLIVLPVGAVTPAGAIPRQRRFDVVDVFTSQSQLDGQAAYISLAAASKLFRTGGSVHGVQGKLNDLFDVDGARRYLYDAFGASQVRVSSWRNSFANLYQAIAVQKLTMFVLLSFLVAVAAFNLVSGLMMIVDQRKADIAVLRTMGASSGKVLTVFVLLGMFLSACGIALGIALGSAIATGLPALYSAVTEQFGLDLMNQYFISYLPVDVRLSDLVLVAAGALAMALPASIFPAWRATRMMPSTVLAHE